jgi:thiosulfate/3-mercaptopyruvate sulfurtransferase
MGIGIVLPEVLIGERARFGSDLSIVDARSRKAYLRGHVPGAVWMDWESWCDPAPDGAGPILAQAGYWGVLAPVDARVHGRRLSKLGLNDRRPIVVYADGPRTRGRDGRIAWMLLYFGAHEVRLLDGGWSGWVEASGPVETEEVMPAEGDMTIRLQPARRRTLRDLEVAYRHAELPLLIDTRSLAEYAAEVQDYLPRRGRLPGAHLLPFSDLFDARGRFLSRHAYVSRLSRALTENTDMVSYCEVGVRASLFALVHETFTGRIVSVYDGSIMEWGRHHDLPME